MVSPPVLAQKVEYEKIDLLQLILIRPLEKVQYSFVVVHDAPHFRTTVAISQL